MNIFGSIWFLSFSITFRLPTIKLDTDTPYYIYASIAFYYLKYRSKSIDGGNIFIEHFALP